MDLNKIKELRQQNSMTQSQLGKRLNVQNTTVSMYEREERQLDPPTINKLCTLFECSSDYLLGRTEHREPMISKKDSAILKAYYAANERDRMLIDTILDAYMDKSENGNRKTRGD